MKVLITGATGLVGSAITALLLKKGYSVNYLTTSKNKIKATANYNGFYWDPSNNTIDKDCLKGVSTIINLAGATIAQRWTKKNKELILKSRINSLKTLYSAIANLENPAKIHLISASAIGIYPNSLSNFYTETTEEVDSSFLGDVTKAWENEAMNFQKLQTKVSIIRIGLVCATDGGALPKLKKTISSYVGAAFGSGNQWQSWIHINDLARMFLYLMKNEVEGIYNGVAPNPVTNTKMVKELAKVLKKPLILPNVPGFLLKTLLGEMSYLLLASQRVSSGKIEKKGFYFEYSNICKAYEELFDDGFRTDMKTKIDIKEFV